MHAAYHRKYDFYGQQYRSSGSVLSLCPYKQFKTNTFIVIWLSRYVWNHAGDQVLRSPVGTLWPDNKRLAGIPIYSLERQHSATGEFVQPLHCLAE